MRNILVKYKLRQTKTFCVKQTFQTKIYEFGTKKNFFVFKKVNSRNISYNLKV